MPIVDPFLSNPTSQGVNRVQHAFSVLRNLADTPEAGIEPSSLDRDLSTGAVELYPRVNMARDTSP